MRKVRKYLPKFLLGVSIHLAGQFVFAVLVSLGISPFLVAIVTAVIAAVWAMIIGLPGPVVLVLMLGAFAFTLAIVFWFKKLLTKRKVVSVSDASALEMTVGESGPYFGTEGSVYGIRRTFNLKLENIDRQEPVSNCSVRILSVSPQTDYEGPWLLKDGILLAAGDHVFIPLVTYGEAREPDKYACEDTFMTTGTADGRPCLDADKEYTLTLRATAPEAAYSGFQCRVWVGDDGKLRIEGQTADSSTLNGSRDPRTQPQQEAAPKSPSWSKLEQRFKDLEPALQSARIAGQTGAAGEHWRLAGASSGDARRRFNAVAAMASTRLFQDFPSEIRRFPELESESDPVIRWYKALQFIADRYEDYRYAEQINDDGSSGGFIFTGSIDQPATASATFCLELASRSIEQA